MSQVPSSPAAPPPIPEVEVEEHKVQRFALWIAKGVTWLLLAYLVIVQIILFLGFLLHLFGANPSSSFVQWAYRNLESAMRPFRGIFQPIELGTAGNDVPATLETSIIFAMVVYGILALVVSAAVNWLSDRINRLDAQEQRERAWAMRERELQALSDRAAIARAEQAAATGAAAAAAATAVADASPASVPASPVAPTASGQVPPPPAPPQP